MVLDVSKTWPLYKLTSTRNVLIILNDHTLFNVNILTYVYICYLNGVKLYHQIIPSKYVFSILLSLQKYQQIYRCESLKDIFG